MTVLAVISGNFKCSRAPVRQALGHVTSPRRPAQVSPAAARAARLHTCVETAAGRTLHAADRFETKRRSEHRPRPVSSDILCHATEENLGLVRVFNVDANANL